MRKYVKAEIPDEATRERYRAATEKAGYKNLSTGVRILLEKLCKKEGIK